MSDRDEQQTPPPGISRSRDSSASDSIELPVVVLGDDVDASREAPRVRLLQGRIHEAWLMYPIYALDLAAGGLAVHFARGTEEWSALPVGLAFVLLYVWNWFYGVAYRYRRRLLKYTSVFVVLGMTTALAYFCFERAKSQLAMVEATAVSVRAGAPSLYWAAILSIVASVVLVAHVTVLGRGYRRKNG